MEKLLEIIKKYDNLMDSSMYVFEYAKESMNEDFNNDVEETHSEFFNILDELKSYVENNIVVQIK